jgi:hypothetical protein
MQAMESFPALELPANARCEESLGFPHRAKLSCSAGSTTGTATCRGLSSALKHVLEHGCGIMVWIGSGIEQSQWLSSGSESVKLVQSIHRFRRIQLSEIQPQDVISPRVI